MVSHKKPSCNLASAKIFVKLYSFHIFGKRATENKGTAIKEIYFFVSRVLEAPEQILIKKNQHLIAELRRPTITVNQSHIADCSAFTQLNFPITGNIRLNEAT